MMTGLRKTNVIRALVGSLAASIFVVATSCSSHDDADGSPTKDSADEPWQEVLESDERLTGGPIDDDGRSLVCDSIYEALIAEYGDVDQNGDDVEYAMEGTGCRIQGVGLVKRDVPIDVRVSVDDLSDASLRSLAELVVEVEHGDDIDQCDLIEREGAAPGYENPELQEGPFCMYEHEENGIFEGALLGSFITQGSSIEATMDGTSQGEYSVEDARQVAEELLDTVMPALLKSTAETSN